MRVMVPALRLLTVAHCAAVPLRYATGRRLVGWLRSSLALHSTVASDSRPLNDTVGIVKKHMRDLGLDALIVPTSDPHMSEYIADHYNRRQFVTGFTGSAGTAIITAESAYLFTDGRYHKQAEMELNSSWTLMRSGLKDVPTPTEFLSRRLGPRLRVGVDPFTHSADAMAALRRSLEEQKHVLVPLSPQMHPVDRAWESRPAPPQSLLRDHPLQYAGKSREEKLKDVRAALRDAGAGLLVVGALDEVMWLLNVRGRDVPCNPVAICYATVSADDCALFIDSGKVPADVRSTLSAAGVQIRPYDALLEALVEDPDAMVMMDPKSVNAGVYSAVQEKRRLNATSPIVFMKASKNDQEVAHMRLCHLRDGAAVSAFLCELEGWVGEGRPVTEVEVDRWLTATRADFGEGLFVEPSFDTIAGVNAHAAIVHYRAKEASCATLTNQDLLLLDSGGQYLDGTTGKRSPLAVAATCDGHRADVTRTMHFGTPTHHQREMFTRVLKGHIAIASAVFPAGTSGCQLDALARVALWKAGKDYSHGTGHGVGAALNVHEGPQRISPLLEGTPLAKHMVVSNEPGYYENDNFGIRIENLLLVAPAPLPSFAGKEFFQFEPLTMIPIQSKMILLEMLTSDERAYMNNYHTAVRHAIVPLLKTDQQRAWLLDATRPL